jgi:hypothetical protein
MNTRNMSREGPCAPAGSSHCLGRADGGGFVSILRGLKEKAELHHGVRIADNAIVAAATLSNRYIADRFARQGDRPDG